MEADEGRMEDSAGRDENLGAQLIKRIIPRQKARIAFDQDFERQTMAYDEKVKCVKANSAPIYYYKTTRK